MRSLIDILDLTTGEIDSLIEKAYDIIANPAKYAEVCKGKKLHDKRDAMAAEAAKRDIDRAIKEKNR